MSFIDTHVHLHFPDYDEDRDQVMKRAEEAGVSTFLNVGTDVETSKICKQLAESYDNIYASAGIHPHDAKTATPEALKEIEALLSSPRVVAIGEVGLDFFRDHSPRDIQTQVLGEFLSLYGRIQKPLIIHCRDAYDELIKILEQEGKAPYRGVMHCFSSNKETMLRLTQLGFHISFAGPLTYRKNDALREACQNCPEDKLLLETDAPFLPPQSMRGKRNETAFMKETAQRAAQIRGVSLETLGKQTTRNAKVLFGI